MYHFVNKSYFNFNRDVYNVLYVPDFNLQKLFRKISIETNLMTNQSNWFICRLFCQTPYTIYHAPYTLHHTPYTLHHTPYMNHTPYTIHDHTIHVTPYTLHHTRTHHTRKHHTPYTHTPYTIHAKSGMLHVFIAVVPGGR